MFLSIEIDIRCLLAEYGPAVIDHMLLKVGFPLGVKLGKGFELNQVDKLVEAFQEAETLLDNALKHPSKVRSYCNRTNKCAWPFFEKVDDLVQCYCSLVENT